MEAGDPAVAMGVYLTALWLVGLDSVLSELANPSADRGAQIVTSAKPSNWGVDARWLHSTRVLHDKTRGRTRDPELG